MERMGKWLSMQNWFAPPTSHDLDDRVEAVVQRVDGLEERVERLEQDDGALEQRVEALEQDTEAS